MSKRHRGKFAFGLFELIEGTARCSLTLLLVVIVVGGREAGRGTIYDERGSPLLQEAQRRRRGLPRAAKLRERERERE